MGTANREAVLPYLPRTAPPGPAPASERFGREIMPVLAENLRRIFSRLPPDSLPALEEIRLRAERPLLLSTNGGDRMLREDGGIATRVSEAYLVTQADVQKTLQLISQGSLYALEEELRNGFITLPGGHRVGLAGKAVLEQGQIRVLKHIGSLNIRLSRAVTGVAEPLIPRLVEPGSGRVRNTLIVSPPRCGKTTLLRDLVRLLSSGAPPYLPGGVKVGLVDERSEVASCYDGVPQNDVGIRTDVLDGCPKAEGILLLLRAMSPDIIAADEIGRAEDIAALEEAVNAGVRIVTTVHAANREELAARPSLRPLWAGRVFQRYVFLSRRRGPGTVEAVWEGDEGPCS